MHHEVDVRSVVAYVKVGTVVLDEDACFDFSELGCDAEMCYRLRYVCEEEMRFNNVVSRPQIDVEL